VDEVAGDPLRARGRVEANRDVDQSDHEVARQEHGAAWHDSVLLAYHPHYPEAGGCPCLDPSSAWRPMLRDALAYSEGTCCSPLSQPLGWTRIQSHEARWPSCASGSPRGRSSAHRRGHGVAAGRSRVGAPWRRGLASHVLSGRHRPLDDGLWGYGLADDAVRRGAGARRSKRSAEGAAHRPHDGNPSVNPP
jgi:hypothetical protein